MSECVRLCACVRLCVRWSVVNVIMCDLWELFDLPFLTDEGTDERRNVAQDPREEMLV